MKYKNILQERRLKLLLGSFLIIYALIRFYFFFEVNNEVATTEGEEVFKGVKLQLPSLYSYLPYMYIIEVIFGLFLIFDKWSFIVLTILSPLSFTFIFFCIANNDLSELSLAIFVTLIDIILLTKYFIKAHERISEPYQIIYKNQ